MRTSPEEDQFLVSVGGWDRGNCHPDRQVRDVVCLGPIDDIRGPRVSLGTEGAGGEREDRNGGGPVNRKPETANVYDT